MTAACCSDAQETALRRPLQPERKLPQRQELKGRQRRKEDAEKKETEAASGEKVKVTLLVTGSFGDKAFNDSAQAGMKKIESEMGDQVEVEMIEMGSDKTKFEGSMLDAAESDATSSSPVSGI